MKFDIILYDIKMMNSTEEALRSTIVELHRIIDNQRIEKDRRIGELELRLRKVSYAFERAMNLLSKSSYHEPLPPHWDSEFGLTQEQNPRT
jgi:hypothetical protein